MLNFWSQTLDSAVQNVVSYFSQMATVYSLDYSKIVPVSTPNNCLEDEE